MIAAISSTSFILLLIFLGWIGIHYRRRQVNNITRQKNTGGSRVLSSLPYGHGDAPLESKDYTRNHTNNIPVSTSLDNIYESVPDQEIPDPTQSRKSKNKKKRSKSKQVVQDLPSEVIQPSDDYAMSAAIPELLSSDTGHVTSSIVHADVHRLSTFASEKGHHVDQSTRQSLRIIDDSGYLSPNVVMSCKSLKDTSLPASSEVKRKQPFHTNTDAGLTMANTESTMLCKGYEGYERPGDISGLDSKDASDVNGLISIDILNYLVAGGIKSGDDDVGYVAVDEIRKSHTDNLAYEVPNGTGKGKGNGGYYEDVKSSVPEGSGGLITVINSNDTLAKIPHQIDESKIHSLGYLVSRVTKPSKKKYAKPKIDQVETGNEIIHHTYLDCSDSMLVERDYSEISNELGKDSPLGPRHCGKAPHAMNTPDKNYSSIDRKLSVCRKVTDETYTPRLQHTYHSLDELTSTQSEDQSFQHQAGRPSGDQISKTQTSKNSGISLGKEEDKEGNANFDIHGYIVLDDKHM